MVFSRVFSSRMVRQLLFGQSARTNCIRALILLASMIGSCWNGRFANGQSDATKSNDLVPGSHVLVFPDYIRNSLDWKAHLKGLKDRMHLVMGLSRDSLVAHSKSTALSSALDVRFVQDEVRDSVRFRKVEYSVFPSQRVKAWLLSPADAKEALSMPAVLCLHQTNGSLGKDEPVGLGGKSDLHYAKELAELGFVTLSPDYPGFGEYEYDFKGLNPFGSGTMKAISDNQLAIDVLQSLPEVDPSKIACIGHSLGGHNAIFTACFDERIRVVVSCCGFTRFHRYKKGDLTGWTSDRYMPRIKQQYHSDPEFVPVDFPEMIASLAPRGFLAIAPESDDNFDVLGVKETVDFAGRAYDLFHAKNALQADYPHAKHEFPEASRKRAYQFIRDQLEAR